MLDGILIQWGKRSSAATLEWTECELRKAVDMKVNFSIVHQQFHLMKSHNNLKNVQLRPKQNH